MIRQPISGRLDAYYPVARGDGNSKIKCKFAEISDKIFILSPLMKFSFATLKELNDENKLDIDEFKHEMFKTSDEERKSLIELYTT